MSPLVLIHVANCSHEIPVPTRQAPTGVAIPPHWPQVRLPETQAARPHCRRNPMQTQRPPPQRLLTPAQLRDPADRLICWPSRPQADMGSRTTPHTQPGSEGRKMAGRPRSLFPTQQCRTKQLSARAPGWPQRPLWPSFCAQYCHRQTRPLRVRSHKTTATATHTEHNPTQQSRRHRVV